MQNKTNRGLSLTPRHATPRHASFDHHLIPRPVNSVNSLRNEPWEHNLWASEILKRRHFKTHQVTIAPIVLQCLFIYLTLCANSGQGADRPSTDTRLQKYVWVSFVLYLLQQLPNNTHLLHDHFPTI